MAAVQNFRSALGGFNREDVVRYIEYINNKHNSEIEQLNTQLQTAREALAQAKAEDNSELKAQLEAAQARCAELEAQLAQGGAETPAKTGDELEAYRRAERAERLARDRAAQIYSQANAALADATVKVEAVSDNLTAMAEQMTAQAQDARNKLQEAVASMYAIRPEAE
jgi:chromosome segregation ATPase